MLEEIRIENLGVIASARLDLGPGLTVITGETGAGKTMVLTGLGLLLGAKADTATVRPGARSAAVEGRVALAEGSPAAARAAEAGADPADDGGSVLLVRTITGGRSRAFVGGRSVPQSVLGEIAAELVTVHGQADQARLRTPSRQRRALDDFAGTGHLDVLAEYRATWGERSTLRAELAELESRSQEDSRETELLRLGLAEVERVAPQPGEDTLLAEQSARLGHAEELRAAVALAHGALSGEDDHVESTSAADGVEAARRALEQASAHDPVLEPYLARVTELGYLLGDVAGELASYGQGIESDPARLDEVEDRRAALGRLTRSFGPDVDAVLAWAEQAGARLAELDGGDERTEALRERLARLDDDVDRLAADLTAARTQAAARLAEAVTVELGALAMAGARLEVAVEPVEAGPTGADAVEMLLVAHPGGPARPLGTGASGGELSRVMLAIEVALATAPGSGAVQATTFVFDEVDAGVGGKAAVEVGQRLALLAGSAQVLVVTHLAQVAAFADRHLVVTKHPGAGPGEVTESDVVEAHGADRVRELARMLSGQEDSAAATQHAAELLERSAVRR